jgi:hypothetical protein
MSDQQQGAAPAPQIGNSVSAEDFEGVQAPKGRDSFIQELRKEAGIGEDGKPPVKQPAKAATDGFTPSEDAPSQVEGGQQSVGQRPARPGTKFTQFSTPEEKARFDRVYGHMKEYERQNQALLQELQALKGQVAGISTQQANREVTSAISQAKAELTDAMRRADYDAVADAQDKLADLRAELKLAAAKPAPKEERTASQDGEALELSEDESATISDWRRQNAYAREGHPQFKRVQSLLQAVAADPEFDGAPLEDLFNEVDRLMGQGPTFGRQERQQAQQQADRDPTGRFVARTLQPMGARQQGQPSAGPKKAALSADQQRIAERMFMDGNTPLARTREEAHKLYAARVGMGRELSVEN